MSCHHHEAEHTGATSTPSPAQTPTPTSSTPNHQKTCPTRRTTSSPTSTPLGGCAGPLVLYRPDDTDLPDWIAPLEPHSARHFGPEDDHVEVMMSDWKQIVESATGKVVEIR